MKKLITLILLVPFSLSLTAQEGAFVGARIMPQSAWILNNDDFDSGDFDFGIPFSMAFALGGGYMFNQSVGIEAQFLYSPQGQEYVDDQKKPYATINNTYFKVPILFRLRAGSEKTAFLLNAGPQLGFLTSSSIDLHGNEPNIDDSKEFYEEFELSFALGFGTSVMLGDHLSLDFLIKLDYGLTEIETALGKETLFDYQSNGREATVNALAAFSAGINYTF